MSRYWMKFLRGFVLGNEGYSSFFFSSFSSGSPLTLFLKFLKNCPIPFPSSGNLLGPKIISTTATIKTISQGPSLNISFLLCPTTRQSQSNFLMIPSVKFRSPEKGAWRRYLFPDAGSVSFFHCTQEPPSSDFLIPKSESWATGCFC